MFNRHVIAEAVRTRLSDYEKTPELQRRFAREKFIDEVTDFFYALAYRTHIDGVGTTPEPTLFDGEKGTPKQGA